MPDTEANPYQPPQSSLDKNFRIEGKLGYRDGGHLLVREGFVAPRICVVTGELVPNDAKAEKLWLKASVAWKVALGIIFGSFIAIGLYQLPLFDLVSPILASIMMFFIFLAVLFWNKPSAGVINVYCCKEILQKRTRFKVFKSLISVVGIGGIFFYDSLFTDLRWMFVILVTITLSNLLNPKSLLKSLGREGDYERFQGAHSNFLDTLPSGSEYVQNLENK